MDRDFRKATKRRHNALLKRNKNIFELTYLQKKHIQQQRKSIKAAYNHIKHPTRRISLEELTNYSFQLGTIIDLTLDPPTAKYGRKILNYVNRYIDYRRGRPEIEWKPPLTQKSLESSKIKRK